MNSPIWFDLLLLLLFVISVAIFFLLQTGRLDSTEQDADSLAQNATSPIIKPTGLANWSLYPRQLVRQSGLPILKSRVLYWALKFTSAVLAVLLMLELPEQSFPPTLILGAIALAFFGTDFWLLLRRQNRRAKIENSLEFFVSLIIVYLNSGFNLTGAFRHAAQYGLQPDNPLGMEVMLMARELESGRERQTAFADLAARTGVKGLARLASIIQVGVGIGAPVTDGLRSHLEVLQLQRRQQDTARVNRKSLETMVPMLLVCFPMFLVLVFFPAAIQILEVLQLLGESL